LLAALPEGEERALVAEIQKVMKDDPAREAYARDEKDLVELLLLLKKEELLEMSRKLYSEIKSAPQGERDYETVMQELLEMNQDIQKIDKELRALE